MPLDLPPLLPLLFRIVCVLHLGLALAYALLQQRYAARYARSQAETVARHRGTPFLPSVDVLVPCYNERPDLLDACLTSVAGQDYEGQLKVFVVDDGSDNRSELLPVLARHGRPGWRIVLLDANVGKRRAMDVALRSGDGDVVVTVDSDTVLGSEDALRQVVLPFADHRVGAVSANLRALNADGNRLTRLINRSYWVLFERERSAQSQFRAVLCCWGGFAAYRRAALGEVWDRHLNQIVRGRRCRTGDDLHLTLELLTDGYDAVFQPRARALTLVPDDLRRYARQQLRWSRSFIRELPWANRAIEGRPPYLAFDLAVQTLMPPLKAAVMVLLLAETLLFLTEWALVGRTRPEAALLFADCGLAFITLLSTSTLGAIQARDLAYLLFGPVYLGIILPAWLHALVSFGLDNWRTRELVPAPEGEPRPEEQC